MSEQSVLEKLFEKLDTKLDKIQQEINDFKTGIQTNIIHLQNKVDVAEIKIKNVENHLNRSFKDRVMDMVMSGVVYSLSACIGISLFFLLLNSVGGNVMAIFKPLLKAFVGV